MKLCHFEAGLTQPLFLIAGPCVIESQQMALDTAGKLQEICSELKINFIYKSSYDKANRSSGKSFRGFGLDAGLKILDEVKSQLGVAVLTDVHSIEEIGHFCADRRISSTP
jgi:2-dehydro-3-deoxyphosphooctonate aldolase (KDO 8-P synthase)